MTVSWTQYHQQQIVAGERFSSPAEGFYMKAPNTSLSLPKCLQMSNFLRRLTSPIDTLLQFWLLNIIMSMKTEQILTYLMLNYSPMKTSYQEIDARSERLLQRLLLNSSPIQEGLNQNAFQKRD